MRTPFHKSWEERCDAKNESKAQRKIAPLHIRHMSYGTPCQSESKKEQEKAHRKKTPKTKEPTTMGNYLENRKCIVHKKLLNQGRPRGWESSRGKYSSIQPGPEEFVS